MKDGAISTEEAMRLLTMAIDRTKKIGDEEIRSAIHETMRKVAEGMDQTAEFFKAADGEQALRAYAKLVRVIADHIESGEIHQFAKGGPEIMNNGATQF